MSYLALHALQKDERLLQRFTVAIQKEAYDIATEADTVPNHATRIAWAKKVMASFDNARNYAWQVLRLVVVWKQLTIEWEDITDAEIQTYTGQVVTRLIAGGF